MADTGIFATTLQVQEKAGTDASAVSNTETYINSYMAQAESVINVMSMVNWSDGYAGLNADVKGILTSAASAWAAIRVANFDLDSYPSQAQVETLIDVLNDEFINAISILRDYKKRTFMNGA